MSPPRESKTSPRRITAKEKRLRAVQLKISGLTFEQIANSPIDPKDPKSNKMYSSRQMAHRAVSQAMRETAIETEGAVSELRALELERCEQLHLSLWPSSRPTQAVRCTNCGTTMWREPNLNAVARLIDLMKRRAALQGLDASDAADARMVALLEQQVEMAHRAMLGAMERAGIPADLQREVMGHAAALLREAEARE